MKQFTDAVQTARLIQLGFPAPKSVSRLSLDLDMDTVPSFAYSIGELIEMLPSTLPCNEYKPPLTFELYKTWRVFYGMQEEYSWEWTIWFEEERIELIDALYAMAVKLKMREII